MTTRHRALVAALAVLLLLGPVHTAGAEPPADPVEDIDPYRPSDAASVAPAATDERRTIRFPVRGASSYVDTFGACRGTGCSRSHMGADIFGAKLQPLVAARDGWITYVRSDAGGTAGNGLAITDEDGWRYLYLHINNDTPDTDDGANPARWRFAPGISMGTKVYAGQHIAYLGDSGNAEGTPPHVHFEIRRPDLVTINPDASLLAASRAPASPRLFVFDGLRGGAADDHIGWGTLDGQVMACDLDGDGADEPLQVRDRVFTWLPDLEPGAPSSTFAYGLPGDTPLCGDWDGDGTDTIGVRRGRTFMLRNTNAAGPADHVFGFGTSSDVPIVGDWDDDGRDTVGVVRDAVWYLSNGLRAGAADRSFRYGRPGDAVLVGDWDGDGRAGIAVRRSRTTMARNVPSGGAADVEILVGSPDDVAVAGDWVGPDKGSEGAGVSLWRPRPG